MICDMYQALYLRNCYWTMRAESGAEGEFVWTVIMWTC